LIIFFAYFFARSCCLAVDVVAGSGSAAGAGRSRVVVAGSGSAAGAGRSRVVVVFEGDQAAVGAGRSRGVRRP